MTTKLATTVQCATCNLPDSPDQMYTSNAGLVCDVCHSEAELALVSDWSLVHAAVFPLPWFLLWVPSLYTALYAGSFGPTQVPFLGEALWVLWGPVWAAGLIGAAPLAAWMYQDSMRIWRDDDLTPHDRALRLGAHIWHAGIAAIVIGHVLSTLFFW